jgi:hypothetical protein
MKILLYRLLAVILIWIPFNVSAQADKSLPFKAGASKIDITPAEKDIPAARFKYGIRDNLYIRAVVVDNGVASAALVSVDVSTVPDNLYIKYIQLIEKETGIPAMNIIISPSHSHSSVRLPANDAKPDDPKVALFAANFEKSIVEAVRQAKGNLQPARVGYREGTSYLNVNRDVIDPFTRLWSQAPNYDGPSDKTVAVVRFETLKGEPIAVYYNYAMHSNSMYMSGVISGDFSGETSKYIEEYYDNKIVALWSMSASGDQNPRYLQPMQDVERLKSEAALATGRAKDTGEANRVAGAGGMDDFDVDPKILARQSQMITSMGQMLGEEILRVMKYMQRFNSEIRIFSSQTTVTCPGRTRTNAGREGFPGTYVDGDPVKIRISLLTLGDIAFAVLSADAYNLIAQRLKEESPYNFTIMVAHSNGGSNSGYIPTDDAFDRNTFQVLNSSLKPGCAERSIIDGFLDMMDKAGR